MSRRDPDERCGSCGVRLASVDRDHEDRCSREADGWPPFQDDPPYEDYLGNDLADLDEGFEQVEACPECAGDGGHEYSHGRYDPLDGALITYWDRCQCCDGTGGVLMVYEPEPAPEPEVRDAA